MPERPIEHDHCDFHLLICSGRFGPLNLQSLYFALLGVFTLVVMVSGLAILITRSRAR